MSETVRIGAPAAPGNAATIVLFDSTVAFGVGGMQRLGLTMLEFIWLQHATNASATNGVRAYASSDGGVNWREVDFKNDSNAATIGSAATVTVPALTSGQEWRETFFVGAYPEIKIEYTAGATAPTTWEMVIASYFGAVAGLR